MNSFKEFILEDTEESEVINYPNGVYINAKMTEESQIALKSYMDKYLVGAELNTEQHATLIYSKKECKELIEPKEYSFVGTFLRFSKFGPDSDILVAELNCDALIQRNKELVSEYNFISDFSEYKPHFTLAYNTTNIDINSLPAIDFAISFHKEEIVALEEQ